MSAQDSGAAATHCHAAFVAASPAPGSAAAARTAASPLADRAKARHTDARLGASSRLGDPPALGGGRVTSAPAAAASVAAICGTALVLHAILGAANSRDAALTARADRSFSRSDADGSRFSRLAAATAPTSAATLAAAAAASSAALAGGFAHASTSGGGAARHVRQGAGSRARSAAASAGGQLSSFSASDASSGRIGPTSRRHRDADDDRREARAREERGGGAATERRRGGRVGDRRFRPGGPAVRVGGRVRVGTRPARPRPRRRREPPPSLAKSPRRSAAARRPAPAARAA